MAHAVAASTQRFPALWETAYDLEADAELLRRRRYGVIEIVVGRLERIVLRPWPKLLVLPEAWRGSDCDRCRLYYNQPRRMPNFLTLKYLVSSPAASYASVRQAVVLLDEIARIKHSDAIVCEARNLRLSERLLARFGWERHFLQSPRRHYIKRFYGEYPTPGGLGVEKGDRHLATSSSRGG